METDRQKKSKRHENKTERVTDEALGRASYSCSGSSHGSERPELLSTTVHTHINTHTYCGD